VWLSDCGTAAKVPVLVAAGLLIPVEVRERASEERLVGERGNSRLLAEAWGHGAVVPDTTRPPVELPGRSGFLSWMGRLSSMSPWVHAREPRLS
jgi:hypothetical protein